MRLLYLSRNILDIGTDPVELPDEPAADLRLRSS